MQAILLPGVINLLGHPDPCKTPGMIEVTCLCGWKCRGTEDEVIAKVQAHGLEVHGVAATREEILALAVQVSA